MDSLSYRLVVITHGAGETLTSTLESFERYVTPAPQETTIHHDPGHLGFCRNVKYTWAEVANCKQPYVFWLEHDFEFTRPLDLEPVARVLDDHHEIGQMSFLRDSVDPREFAAGGIYNLHKERFAHRDGWLEQEMFFTTNPSLMRRQFMADNPWPNYASECEGKFTSDLRGRGYSFGVWGEGEVWVRHTGQLRTGFGY